MVNPIANRLENTPSSAVRLSGNSDSTFIVPIVFMWLMPATVDHARNVFARLTRTGASTKRLITLLRPHDSVALDWAMFVPTCFNAALDILQTERITKVNGGKTKMLMWTQGNNFQFSAGDTLYDTPLAYNRWSEALAELNCCVQVTSSTPRGVTFSMSAPCAERTKLTIISSYTLAQADFVELLINGAVGEVALPRREV
jgi:hypothetical protein